MEQTLLLLASMQLLPHIPLFSVSIPHSNLWESTQPLLLTGSENSMSHDFLPCFPLTRQTLVFLYFSL